MSWADLVHRIGRAGRFGSKAIAINFVCDEDLVDMNVQKFPEKTQAWLVDEVIKQLRFRGAQQKDEKNGLSKKAAQRLDKEHRLIHRRDELVEEFKETRTIHKKAKMASKESMIGKWKDIDSQCGEDSSFLYFNQEED